MPHIIRMVQKRLLTLCSMSSTSDEIIAVVGVFGDKDATGIFEELEPIVDSCHRDTKLFITCNAIRQS